MTPIRLARPLWAGTALALLALALVVPSTGASTVTLDAGRLAVAKGDFVDPQLLGELARGPAIGVFGWDDREASRAEVEGYLDGQSFGTRLFESVSVGIACLGGATELPALTRTPGVRSVYADAELTPALDRSVPTAFNEDPNHWWGVEGITGEGVGIAVIDTGIDGTHPDLAFGSRIKRNVVTLISHQDVLGIQDMCPNVDFYYPPEYQENPVTGGPFEDLVDTETTSGHGTHLASVAAGDGTASGGRLKGMAPGAELFGVQVIGDASPTHEIQVNEETTYRPSLVRMIAGIDYLMRHGLDEGILVKVALLGFTREGLFSPYSPAAIAVRGLYDSQIAVVLPAGNEGPLPSDCAQPETCQYNPLAMRPFAIGVGASPRTSRTALEGYSSRGDPSTQVVELSWPSNIIHRYEPLLVAPGTGVVAARRLGLAGLTTIRGQHTLGAGGSSKQRQTDLDYQALTGTSVAAAHVAGAIALMQQAALEAKGCYLTVQQVYEVLEQTATPMPGYARHQVGAGMLDATAAIWGARFAPKFQTIDTTICPPAG